MEMLLTGEMIDPDTAVQFGLINRAVATGQLDAELKELAERIASKSTHTVRIGKRAFYEQIEMNLDQACEFTAAVMTRNMLDDDATEGIDAFLQKRQPRWQGS
jgi:enoyl-CoA hydratase/carnithine racemase